MEKCILDVQLKHGLRSHSSHKEEKMNISHLDNRRKSVIAVGTIYLSIPLATNRAIRRSTWPFRPILIV